MAKATDYTIAIAQQGAGNWRSPPLVMPSRREEGNMELGELTPACVECGGSARKGWTRCTKCIGEQITPPGHKNSIPEGPWTFRGQWARRHASGNRNVWYRGDVVYHEEHVYVCTEDNADPDISPDHHWKWEYQGRYTLTVMASCKLAEEAIEYERAKQDSADYRQHEREVKQAVEEGNAGVTMQRMDDKLAEIEDLSRQIKAMVNPRDQEVKDLEKEVKSLRFNLAPPFPREDYDPEGKYHRCEGCGWRMKTKNMKLVPMIPKTEAGDDIEDHEECYTFCSNKCVTSFLRGGGRQMTLGSKYSIYYPGDHHTYLEEHYGRDKVPVIHDNRLMFVASEASKVMMSAVGGAGILFLMALAAIVSHFIW